MTTTTVRSISPDTDPVLQRQLLIEAAEQIATDPRDDVVAVVRDLLTSNLGYTALELHAVLVGVAYTSGDLLSLRTRDVHDALTAAEQHGAVTGHEVCCGDPLGLDCDRCFRTPADAPRCQTCESRPHELLDDAVRALLDLLRDSAGSRAVDELCGGAA
jgi:hypothetical protein